MNKIVSYMFILILVLILVAYYTGTQSVAGTFFDGIRNLVYVLQGRKPSDGTFADYPKQ